MSSKRYKSIALAMLAAIVLFAAIFLWVGPNKVWETLLRMNPYYMAIVVIIEMVDIFFLNIRWHVFVKPVAPKITIKETLALSLSGAAVSNVTPGGRVGGEPLKAYFMKRVWGISYSASFATIILERIIDMMAFLVISGIAILYAVFVFHLQTRIVVLLIIAFLFAISMMVGLWYVTLKKQIKTTWFEKLLKKHKWLMDKLPVVGYYENELAKSLDEYYSYITRIASEKKVLVLGFTYSTIYWLLEISRAYFIFMALGVNAPFPVIALAYVFSTIIGSLPAGVGGVGLTEATMILIYSTSNINTVVASLETMIDRLFSYWLIILIGLPIAGYLGIKPMEEIEDGGLHDSTGKGSKERKVRNN